MDSASNTMIDRLIPQVAQFVSGEYSLGNDLTRLQGVRSIGATEATIFYSARILEVIAAHAVEKAGMTPSASPFANLETLCQFGFVPRTTMYWANGLRRLGNDVRHILRHTDPADADLAALFAGRWIDWFFCQFRFGPALSAVTRDGQPVLAGHDPRISELLRAMDAEDFDPKTWMPAPGASPDSAPYMIAATIAAVIADILLDRGECDAAFNVLDAALARFPDDLRLQQLVVLAWKRRGDLKKAVELAASLVARSRDDDETAGIVAGVYKQIYLAGNRDQEMLLKSYRAYAGGWDGSKCSNAYLGINAAATALWLGRAAESRRVAGEVRQLLLHRVAAMAGTTDAVMLAASYWDQVTLAEAELLIGEICAARSRYQNAFTRSAKAKGNIKVASDQAQRHLPPLGLSVTDKEFFKPAAALSTETFSIGVTGHRNLADESPLRAKVIEIIAQAAAGKTPLALSALAAGSDCLVAEAVLDDRHGRLHAVLPLEVADYQRDFNPIEAARFQSLLNRADAIIYPAPAPAARPAKEKKTAAAATPPASPAPATTSATAAALADRQAAYERTGIYIVDQCQLLIAVWDGLPARGRGGTADIVAYARKIGRAIAWINSIAPFDVVMDAAKLNPRAAGSKLG